MQAKQAAEQQQLVRIQTELGEMKKTKVMTIDYGNPIVFAFSFRFN